MVVTDLEDQTVPAHMQTEFVRMVRGLGGRVSQFLVTATDPKRHQVLVYARRAMAACLAGTGDDEIQASLTQISARRLQARMMWEARLAAKAAAASRSEADPAKRAESEPGAPTRG